MTKGNRLRIIISILVLASGLLAGCTVKNNAASTEDGTASWRDYNGKRLGVLVGPLMEDAAKEYFPDSEYLIFNSYPDCITCRAYSGYRIRQI